MVWLELRIKFPKLAFVLQAVDSWKPMPAHMFISDNQGYKPILRFDIGFMVL